MIAEAYRRRWFYAVALTIASIYGFGGLVHVGNVLGFGELKWSAYPVSWKIGDIWWGTLDVAALAGVATRSSAGIWALALAAVTQVVAYGFVPEAFATTEAHHRTLEILVYFNAAVLVVLAICLGAASREDA